MAHNIQLTNLAVNAMVDALTALMNSGIVRIYAASQPATGDTALGAQALLAEITLNATAFGAASAGVATANSITSDTSANNTGTAAWFRIFKSDGTTAVWDGSVGTSGCDLNLVTTSLVAGETVGISSFTITHPKS